MYSQNGAYMNGKQIRMMKKKYGMTLDGEAIYFAHQSFGIQEEDLINAGFNLIGGKKEYISAAIKHSRDSQGKDSMIVKIWRDMFLEGSLDPKFDANDEKKKQKMLKMILKVLKEVHKHNLKTGLMMGDNEMWPSKHMNGRDVNPQMRARALDWFYGNVPSNWSWCSYCKNPNIN